MTGFTARDEPEPHLDPEEVARHVADTSPPDERARVEAHLAACDRCTEEVVAAWRFSSRRRSRPLLMGFGIAAAALIAGVMFWLPGRSPSAVPGSMVRGPGTDTALAIVVVSPADRDSVSPEVVLTWRSRPNMATYKVSVGGADGDSIWAATTPDTAVPLPDSVVLTPGLDYFWYVDGLMADGRAVTSGIHQFRLRR